MNTLQETARLPQLLVTGVGSLPHADSGAAVDLILQNLKDAPHAPQLSRAHPFEQMWIQCTEGLPRFVVDAESSKYYFDTSGDVTGDLEAFYTAYLEVTEGNRSDEFAISRMYGGGLHLFAEGIRSGGRKLPFLKVQVTGPISFATTVTDENKKPIFYHPIFRDVAVKGMGLKAVWLVEFFKPLAENIIVFFDEPSLSAYGSSAFLGVSKNDVIESLDEVIAMVVERGAIPGVHCCGNTDWGLLMETSTQIVNFDGVDYLHTMGIYRDAVSDFLARKGVLAWGVVPNTPKAIDETPEHVIERLKGGIKMLEDVGIDRDLLTEKLIITPACGCAGLTEQQASHVYRLLSGLEAGLPADLL